MSVPQQLSRLRTTTRWRAEDSFAFNSRCNLPRADRLGHCTTSNGSIRLRLFSAGSTVGENSDAADARLQKIALSALGERRGTIILVDPQTGRIRAVVNSQLAFEENLPAGSTIKPFTALSAMRAGLIDTNTQTVCREKYSHEDFQTICSHPRDLSPLNPTEAIAYSCNYYFGKVGERMNEANFVSTLSEFGFGKKTGVNAEHESQGLLPRDNWHSQDAIGETNDIQATPIQLINAYSALLNGGHLFVPRVASARNFAPELQRELAITPEHRSVIVKGMRGAVRYGTAETASLYSLPIHVIGKTGTATQINGFRSQGWFVGFSSGTTDIEPSSELAANSVRLGVLVFLRRAHGSEAAEVARPIFDEYSRLNEVQKEPETNSVSRNQDSIDRAQTSSPRLAASAATVRVHLVRENVTRQMSLEEYVRGVVAAEGSMETELEAMKALAIASRTYAIKNLGRHTRDGYDFCTTTHCQTFRGTETGVSFVSPLVIQAVAATEGEVLRDAGDQVVDSYFSASCGGATANIASLWGGSAPPYLRGMQDEFCSGQKHHDWTDVISEAQLTRALQSDARTNVGERLLNVSVGKRDASGRAELINVEGDRRIKVNGWDFKIIVGRALGWNLLKSSRFEITRSGSNYVFRGSGFGHGLGLCQEGAHVMAARGATSQQILAKYFPSTHVVKENVARGSADLMWTVESSPEIARGPRASARSARQTLSSESFRINYPSTISRSEIEDLLGFLQASRKSLTDRVASAGLRPQLPALEVFINETTGDFVGRTGQPAWAAAATKGHRIELQPLNTLKRRRVLETTLRHELVHTLIDAIGGGRTPRWLAEGLALHFAGEGSLINRYEPRSKWPVAEIERKLTNPGSSSEMRIAYAAAYGEVKRLIGNEGEANVWRRIAR